MSRVKGECNSTRLHNHLLKIIQINLSSTSLSLNMTAISTSATHMKVSNFNPSPHRNINCLGHDLKTECKKRAQEGTNWTETELVDLYKQLVGFLNTLNQSESLHRRINPRAIVF